MFFSIFQCNTPNSKLTKSCRLTDVMKTLKCVVFALLLSSESDSNYVDMSSAAKSPVSPREKSPITHSHDYEASNQRAIRLCEKHLAQGDLRMEKRKTSKIK